MGKIWDFITGKKNSYLPAYEYSTLSPVEKLVYNGQYNKAVAILENNPTWLEENLKNPQPSKYSLAELAAMKGDLRLYNYITTDNLFGKKGENIRSSLHLACKNGHIDVVNQIINDAKKTGNLNELVNNFDEYGRTPLISAINGKRTDVVSVLLKAGADPLKMGTGAAVGTAIEHANAANYAPVKKILEERINDVSIALEPNPSFGNSRLKPAVAIEAQQKPLAEAAQTPPPLPPRRNLPVVQAAEHAVEAVQKPTAEAAQTPPPLPPRRNLPVVQTAEQKGAAEAAIAPKQKNDLERTANEIAAKLKSGMSSVSKDAAVAILPVAGPKPGRTQDSGRGG
jgi:hypothetical protein